MGSAEDDARFVAKVDGLCTRACLSQPLDEAACKGGCSFETLSCNGFTCPQGAVCTNVETIQQAEGEPLCRFEICDLSTRPIGCNDNEDIKKILSLSIFDEDDRYVPNQKRSDWLQFRELHPTAQFIVGKVTPLQEDIDAGYVFNTPEGYDGGVIAVGRNSTTDIFTALGDLIYTLKAIQVSVDISGSLELSEVQRTLDLLKVKCNNFGILFCFETTDDERWIYPHLGQSLC